MSSIQKQRIIAALEWLTLDAKNRFDDCRDQLEPGSQGGYSAELLDALAVLDELKGDTDTDADLKIYVWDDYAPDHTNGLAFAIAESEAAARALVIESAGYETKNWGVVITYPLGVSIGYACHGGG